MNSIICRSNTYTAILRRCMLPMTTTTQSFLVSATSKQQSTSGEFKIINNNNNKYTDYNQSSLVISKRWYSLSNNNNRNSYVDSNNNNNRNNQQQEEDEKEEEISMDEYISNLKEINNITNESNEHNELLSYNRNQLTAHIEFYFFKDERFNRSLLKKALMEDPKYSDAYLQYNICQVLQDLRYPSPDIIKLVMTNLRKEGRKMVVALFIWMYNNIRDEMDIGHYDIVAGYYNDTKNYTMAARELANVVHQKGVKHSDQSYIEMLRSCYGDEQRLDEVMATIVERRHDGKPTKAQQVQYIEMLFKSKTVNFDKIAIEFRKVADAKQVDEALIQTALIGWLKLSQIDNFNHVWDFAIEKKIPINNTTIGVAVGHFQRIFGIDHASLFYLRVQDSSQEVADSEPVFLGMVRAIMEHGHMIRLTDLVNGLQRRGRLTLDIISKIIKSCALNAPKRLGQCLVLMYARAKDISPIKGVPTLETLSACMNASISQNSLLYLRIYLREMYTYEIVPDAELSRTILRYLLVLGDVSFRDLEEYIQYTGSKLPNPDPYFLASCIIFCDLNPENAQLQQRRTSYFSIIDSSTLDYKKNSYNFLIGTYVLMGEIDKAIYYFGFYHQMNFTSQTMKYSILAHYALIHDVENQTKWGSLIGQANYNQEVFDRFYVYHKFNRRTKLQKSLKLTPPQPEQTTKQRQYQNNKFNQNNQNNNNNKYNKK
ncbi:hypothetical protein DFA_10124 [Cavenderia fasciculata]|uniref:Uncharacterized protein n=1 Tax=Cavenderia fasciculata TaxID=261658 RepID=F4Q9C1_CACFS|nr:uncharacterized protein DFA_10124 [Cavenderia fasciculata]EGG15290.1 hypothetical protein DFA_10124 [Cavenderia fasciculata]|eukprot:XP_004352010.1 hypothetical protein DFA_10124 [Cavenderia fasciculata]